MSLNTREHSAYFVSNVIVDTCPCKLTAESTVSRAYFSRAAARGVCRSLPVPRPGSRSPPGAGPHLCAASFFDYTTHDCTMTLLMFMVLVRKLN